jgi:hypothetical protein
LEKLVSEGTQSKFKAEISLLMVAIILFMVSAFFYSYQAAYRGYAISFVGFGSVLMVAASISYSKRGKNCV